MQQPLQPPQLNLPPSPRCVWLVSFQDQIRVNLGTKQWRSWPRVLRIWVNAWRWMQVLIKKVLNTHISCTIWNHFQFYFWLHSAEEEQCTAIAGYQDTLGQLSEHLSSLVQSLERQPQVCLTPNLSSFMCCMYVHKVISFQDPLQ